MDQDLVPCAGCKNLKVLKLGDYCRDCALDIGFERYYIVKPAEFDIIARATGITHEYLKAKSEKAFEEYKTYVIYYNGSEWKEILISDFFHVPTAMKNLLAKGKK